MSSDVKPNRIFDCIGFYCPQPVFRTRSEPDKMDSNEILEGATNDKAAEEGIKRVIKRTGNALMS